MPDTSVNILGFPTSTLRRDEILLTVVSWIEDRRTSRHLMALNPIKVCRARREARLAQHILTADLVYPDAYGIAWAMRRFSGQYHSPIPGCDLMLDIMREASHRKYRVYLLGASDAVVKDTYNIFTRDYPGAQMVGYRNGYFADEQDKRAAAEQILVARPDIVFVAMGALIQEDWILRIQQLARDKQVVVPVLMGVGGSFDAVTGHVPRPPRWMLRLHLEWLFRLVQQPIRAPRMLALPRFALLVAGKKYMGMRLDYRTSDRPHLRSQLNQPTGVNS